MLTIAAAVAVTLFLCVTIAWTYIRHHAEPIARQRIIENLEYKLHCKVELDEVHVSILHGLQVTGSGLRIMAIGNQQPTRPGAPPMLSARTFQFATTFTDLLFHHSSAITAYAQGLSLDIPPANAREPLQQGDPAKHNQPRNSIFLNRLVATDSQLIVESSKSDGIPITLDFNKLILDDPGKNLPFIFETILTVPKPVGEIHSTGHIGPWVFGNARESPVDGNYTFEHADLSSITGINGTLSSAGRITGRLGAMQVHGTADTPDFSLDTSAHPFAVHTKFQALVDGTTGDVALDDVAGHFLHSSLNGNGLIRTLHPDGPKAPAVHHIALDIHMINGRAEDLLVLFDKASRPLLTGVMNLNGHLEVPPGKQRLVLKLRATGKASIGGAIWSSPSVQQNVDTLSQRAENNSRQAMANPAANPLVASSMAGLFNISGGNIDITRLNYRFPGAVVLMDGRYPLVNRELDFHGVGRTVATASEMETGWKSFLLKPISPFLKKNGAGMQLPVSFTGDKSSPHFALDLKNRKPDDAIAQSVPAAVARPVAQPSGGRPPQHATR